MKNIIRKIKEKLKYWNETFEMKKKFTDNYPSCFYDLAEKYLPSNEKAVIIDVGCGKCEFESYLNLWNKYEKLIVLDGNTETINKIKEKVKSVHNIDYIIKYIAPNKMNFENESVDYIFCSHLVEHLDFKDLYKLLKEFNRVLKNDGIIVISAPMITNDFYGTFTHVRPYHASVFRNYLYSEIDNTFYTPISKMYELKELVYRYHTVVDIQNSMGSSIKWIDFLIQIPKYILKSLGIKKYVRNGYTIILKKLLL